MYIFQVRKLWGHFPIESGLQEGYVDFWLSPRFTYMYMYMYCTCSPNNIYRGVGWGPHDYGISICLWCKPRMHMCNKREQWVLDWQLGHSMSNQPVVSRWPSQFDETSSEWWNVAQYKKVKSYSMSFSRYMYIILWSYKKVIRHDKCTCISLRSKILRSNCHHTMKELSAKAEIWCIHVHVCLTGVN